MPQPADFPITMVRLNRNTGLAETAYPVTNQEVEDLGSDGYARKELVQVDWPKLLRHPDGRTVQPESKRELDKYMAEGFGFPRDVPRPTPPEKQKLVSVVEMDTMRKDLQQQLADMQAKLNLYMDAPRVPPAAAEPEPEKRGPGRPRKTGLV